MQHPTPRFIHPVDHFERLVDALPDDERTLFRKLSAIRVETAYAGRTFIVYRIDRYGDVQVLDKLEVLDLEINEEVGGSTEVRSHMTGDTFVVGYTPERVPGQDVFMWMPLHQRVRFDAIPDRDDGDIVSHSVGFNLCVKVSSRIGPRERDTVHCETGAAFHREFPRVSTDI